MRQRCLAVHDAAYYISVYSPGTLAMAQFSASPKGETFTFRLDPGLKAALVASAAEVHKQPGQFVRELLQSYLSKRERRVFEEEARRQCTILTDAARDPDGDEAQVMRELDANLEEFGAEWR